MNTLINVARYHLVDRVHYILMPWVTLAFVFLVNLVVNSVVTDPDGKTYTGTLPSIYIVLFVLGVLSVTSWLPFGLALGLSRRSYYLGTTLTVAGLGAVYGLALAALQVIERVTGGWGLAVYAFRLPWILDSAWYLTWLTSFVVLVLMYVYGMWFGLVYRRWSTVGLVTFIAAQVTVLLAAALIATWTQAWPQIGQFFATLTAIGLTGVLAAIAAVLALGGFTTMRRVTI